MLLVKAIMEQPSKVFLMDDKNYVFVYTVFGSLITGS